MALAAEQIRSTECDEELFRLLSAELNRLFPPELRNDPVVFLSRLQSAPVGLRAMASIYDLDVSMALDDLAWHFINHHESLDVVEETALGLRELDALEAAEIFQAALEIVKPYWQDLQNDRKAGAAHDWLDSTGIQGRIDPLNRRMWELLEEFGSNGLLSLWLVYARKYPERCVIR